MVKVNKLRASLFLLPAVGAAFSRDGIKRISQELCLEATSEETLTGQDLILEEYQQAALSDHDPGGRDEGLVRASQLQQRLAELYPEGQENPWVRPLQTLLQTWAEETLRGKSARGFYSRRLYLKNSIVMLWAFRRTGQLP